MTELIKTLTAVADSEKIPTNAAGTKLEQKYARALKESIISNLIASLNAEATDSVKVVRTADGIALAIDTEAGFVTVVIDATLKNLDYDPFTEADDYVTDKATKAAKAKEKADAKAAKIAKDKAEREAKAKAKASA